MPLPFAIPFIPILKLMALGSIKIIALLVGALIMPRWTLRLMIKGAAGVVLPVGKWLLEYGRVDASTVEAVEREMDVMLTVSYSRKEARTILLGLVKKTVRSMMDAVVGVPKATGRLFRRMFGNDRQDSVKGD